MNGKETHTHIIQLHTHTQAIYLSQSDRDYFRLRFHIIGGINMDSSEQKGLTNVTLNCSQSRLLTDRRQYCRW